MKNIKIEQKNKTRWQGFTLIETIIVLMIVSLFVFLPTVATKELKETVEVQQFLNRFEKQLHLAQQSAIVSGRTTTVFPADLVERVWVFRMYDQRVELPIPDGLTGNRAATIRFTGVTGTSSSVGKKFTFTWNKKQQKIIYEFLFGRGHYVKRIENI